MAAGDEWSQQEVELLVADYFAMLVAELSGQQYSKTDHRKRLRPLLSGRSDGSIEFKRCNVSAVLIALRQPYIRGYQPRANYQAMLFEVVEDFLSREHAVLESPQVTARIEAPTMPVLVAAASSVFEAPPDLTPLTADVQPWQSHRGRRIDFVERDARSRKLGQMGEEFAVELERRRLAEAGRDDLAGRVVWAARDHGDGLGYDVLSFNETNESEKWIEVKTTTFGSHFPFMVTANEIGCSEAEPEKFNLYRVHSFTAAPKVFVLSGAISAACRLTPTAFRAEPSFT